MTIGMAPGTPHGRIRACLDGHAPALVAAYFEPDCGFAADTFDTVGENPPDKFAVGDLLALNLLDERLGPRAVRALLSSEGNREIGLIGIDPDARLGDEGDGEVLAEAHEVWNRLCRLDGVGPVKAGKLLARKRPRLVPIVDSVVIRVVGAGRGRYWSVFGEFMGDEANRNLLRTMRPESAVESASLLRVLDVAIWTRGSGSTRACALRDRLGVPDLTWSPRPDSTPATSPRP